jgi:hypothetical protein
MCVISYYKLGQKWFLDLPDYLETAESSADELERIGSFHDFLQWCAGGSEQVLFKIHTEFFEGADVLQLTGTSGENTGAYYRVEHFNGTKLDLELWFNKVAYYFANPLPSRIYIRQLS